MRLYPRKRGKEKKLVQQTARVQLFLLPSVPPTVTLQLLNSPSPTVVCLFLSGFLYVSLLLPFPQEIPGETCHDITESSRINTKPKLLSPPPSISYVSFLHNTLWVSKRLHFFFFFYNLREAKWSGKLLVYDTESLAS